MAEYIKLDAIMEYCQNQKDKTINCNDLARFPTADVIERSKIDKAIKEIERRNFDNEPFIIGECLKTYRDEVLEIIKRNIGE